MLGTLAAALLAWSAPAQESDPATELEVPDLTVTAEDPLTLMPPLGPEPDASPIPLPPLDATRARPRETPPPPTASGTVPAPAAALQTARAPDAVARSVDIEGRAVLLDLARLRALHGALSLGTGTPGREAALALAATTPLQGEGATRIAARGRLDTRGRQLGLDLALASAVGGHALQARLAADGPAAGTATYARWRSGSRAALEALLELQPLPPALEVMVGGAVVLEAGAVHALPAGRVTYAPAAEWRLEAGVRPAVGFPAWLLDPAGNAIDDLELAPERAWMAWLGGGYGDFDLRLGVAHGLIHGFDGYAVASMGADAVLAQLMLQWDTVARRGPPGDISLRVVAGAAVAWTSGAEPLEAAAGIWSAGVLGRLLLDATWPVLATPPVAIVVRAGLLQAPLYGVEEWPAGSPPPLGLSARAGLRWAPAHGHQLQFLAGIRGPSERDLTVYAGIEYARSVVRLVAPPVTATR